MASFTEQATLKVNDQSSAALKKINAELKKLETTAKSLKSVTIKFTVNDKAIQSAIRNARSLKREVDRLGGHGGNTRLNVQVNTHGLTQAQRQIQQLRAQAARPINVNTRHTGGGAGAGAGGGAGGAGAGRRGLRQTGIQHQLGNFSVLRGAASVFVGGTAYAVAAAVTKALKEGATEVDTGYTSLYMKQLDRIYGRGAEDRALRMLEDAQRLAGQVGYRDADVPYHKRIAIAGPGRLMDEQDKTIGGGAFWNIGQRARNFAEALGITQVGKRPSGEPEYRPALQITAELEEMTRTLVGLGQSMDKAEDGAINFAKGMEQTGRWTDRLTGAFDAEKMKADFNFLRQLMPTIGKEFSGNFTKGMIKYLSSEKYTVGNEALARVMLMGEEQGTRAAVGYHQAVKQLSGQGQKKDKIAFMIANDLLEVTGYKPGKPARAATRRHPARAATRGAPIIGGPKDEELLRTNLPAWIDKHLVPILEEEGIKAGKKAIKEGELSPSKLNQFVEKYKNDPTKLASLASKVVGDRTAVETITAFLERSQEFQRQVNEAFMRSGKPEDLRKATGTSINIAAAQMQNQFKGAMGVAVHRMAPFLTEQMRFGSEQLDLVSQDLLKSQREGKVPLDAMARISSALAPAAIAAALTSAITSPQTAPFALASAGLIFAGHLLVQAANKFLGDDEATRINPFGKATTPEAMSVEDAQARIDTAKLDQAKLETQLRNAEQQLPGLLEVMERHRERTGKVPAALQKQYDELTKTMPTFIESLKHQIAALESQRKALEEQLPALRERKKKGDKYDKDVDDYNAARRQEAYEEEEYRKWLKSLTPAQRKAQNKKRERWAPMPRPRPPQAPWPYEAKDQIDPVPVIPVTKGGPLAPAEPSLPDPVPVIPVERGPDLEPPKVEVPQPLQVIPGPGAPPTVPVVPPGGGGLFPGPAGAFQKISFTDVVDPSTISGAFESTFNTGASTIGKSGTTVGTNATAEMNAGAGGIGAAIGAAFVAVASGVSIDVNVPNVQNASGRGSPGTQAGMET